jgi:PAS domain S-box-containing protein
MADGRGGAFTHNLKLMTVGALVLWTVVAALVLLVEIRTSDRHVEQIAIREARAIFDKDQAIRLWATSHGGVYVETTERTPPNPYLAHVPERDVVTPSGRNLTLMNPAYVVRQMQEDYARDYGVMGHLTSLKLLRPENAPDRWETEALRRFDAGVAEVMEFTDIDGRPHLRLMRPMIVREGCMKCHGHQNYAPGEVRGGVSISLPLGDIAEAAHAEYVNHVGAYGSIWLLGLTAILWGGWELDRRTRRLVTGEQRLRSLIDTAPIVILTLTADGTVTEFNPEAQRLYGVDREAALGSRYPERFVPAERREGVAADIERALAEGSVRDSENDIVVADGSVRTILWSMERTVDGRGAATGLIAVGQDITERHEARRRIAASEKALTEAQRIARMGNWDWDIVANTLAWSDEIYRIFGLTPRQFGATYDAFLERVHPDDRRKVVDAVDTTLETNVPYDIDHRIVRPDGVERIVHEQAKVYRGDDGRPTRMIGVVRDVTEERLADERNRRLAIAMENAADMVVITDADGVIGYVNPAFERVTGFSRTEAVGATPRILKSGRHDETFYRELWETIVRGEVWQGRIVNRRKNGGVYEEDVSIAPVSDSKGTITGYVAIKRDVTQAAILDKARDFFASATSHELRTPLTKLRLAKMLFDAAERAEPSPPLRQAAAVFDEALTDLDRVAAAVGAVADITTLGKRPHRVIDGVAAVRLAVEEARSRARAEGRAVVVDLDISAAGTDVPVVGDEAMIRRALEEVLSNAVKYTVDGKRVAVTVATDERRMTIAVVDEGIGFTLTDSSPLFDPFFSLEKVTHHATGRYKYLGGGIGLGLTVARMILDLHGGAIDVASKGEGEGARVTITLPLRR